jgi:large subunit ribosomal protein L23
VEKVNTMNVSGKWRRVRYVPGKTAAWKKAIVTLKKGEKIDLTK